MRPHPACRADALLIDRWPETATLVTFWVDMAVPSFIFVSGLVWLISLERRGVNRLRDAYEQAGLCVKALKLVVPFALIFAFREALIFLVKGPVGPAELMVSFLTGGNGPGSYYFPIILQFILLYPLVYFSLRRWGKMGLARCMATNAVYELAKWAIGMPGWLYRLAMLRYISVIAYGCWAALGGWRSGSSRAVAGVVGFAFLVADSYLGLSFPTLSMWTTTCWVACLWAVPFISTLSRSEKLNKNYSCIPLEMLGRHSYDIFLVQTVYFLGVGMLYKYTTWLFLRLMINFSICISLGLLFGRLETPIYRWVCKKTRLLQE